MADDAQETDFEDTPRGWAQRWNLEISASKAMVRDWHEKADRITKVFRDERDGTNTSACKWNLFTANIQTVRPMLYGQTPAVSVERRFADANDDVARVAAEMLERLLNADIEKDSDSYARALKYVLDDRLLPGLGIARVRYVADHETIPETPAKLWPDGREAAPAVPAQEKKVREYVETDYVHWKDFLWSAGARVWHEARWVAFRVQMSRAELKKRFGKVASQVPLNAKPNEDEKKAHPWGRADVWEIWSKDHKKTFWYVEGYDVVLDMQDDPYGLEGFWPCPEPFLANVTTSGLIPRPDYAIAQDLYDEVDTLSTRIKILEDAIRVAGVYDKAAGPNVERLLSPREDNALFPVDNWALHAEKGGLRGMIDWLPIEQITAAITALVAQRQLVVDALYQVTGMSDILRGQATQGGVTATEQAMKARFGSVRIQALQDEFARFASDIQRLKAELISKHFEVATILECSNSEYGFDAQLAPQAAELLKSKFASYRIAVKPESVSLQDFAALKAERMEVLGGLSTFISAATPVMQTMPGSLPFLLQVMQWAVSGLKGSAAIEGVLDTAIAAAQQQAQQPQAPAQPDTKLLAQQMKGQQDQAKIQAELQADLTRTHAEVQADAQREQNQALWNTREASAKHALAMQTRQLNPGPNKPNGRGGGL